MPRRLRPPIPGGIFHITARGNRLQPIFLCDRDRVHFLVLLATLVAARGWKVHAYCLMTNHYHLLVETPNGDLSAGLQWLNGRYAQWFNYVHGFSGHLFQGRFYSVLVESQHHLLELSRYIVLNPVRAGICRRAQDWPWSSYRECVQSASKASFLEVEWLVLQFGSNLEVARRRYATFVEEAQRQPRPRSP
jgi:REP element-mobilizing transposase RayT